MTTVPPTLRQQQSTVLSLVAIFIMAFVCLQLWLLVETIGAALQPQTASVLPEAVVSLFCTLASWALWRLLQRGRR
jgi:apolipoprotein N-acyltransferase